MDKTKQNVTFGALLITLGIVFGDIGTSPLYVFYAITGGQDFDPVILYGTMSCIFWTLFLIVGVKYITLALNSDNQGEGGIFALYALLRKTNSKWIIFPALIGCATLISDGFITPAISISSAIEGLNVIMPSLPTIPIVCFIITGLFIVQQFGTNAIGKFFGPVMMVWFLTIGLIGAAQLSIDPTILKSINPIYAFDFLAYHPGALWILGAVFLCATGAEALYSDLGHCGKKNIRISWIFVWTMLLLNYFGQASYMLNLPIDTKLDSIFYSMVSPKLLPLVIAIATLATIIASQALITGIFTLVNEAIKLKLWTNLKVKYPSTHKGQIYIPAINYLLLFGCLIVIFIFKKSSNMEAAYGLAITIDMLMTSLLLGYLIWINKSKTKYILVSLIVLFGIIESLFLISNMNKISHGGWFTLTLAFGIFSLLYLFYVARGLRAKHQEYKTTQSLVPILVDIAQDKEIPLIATHLVYPSRSNSPKFIDSTIVYSLIHNYPKKAKYYWFVHIEILDEPWKIAYKTIILHPESIFFVTFKLGFKESHDLQFLMEHVIGKMSKSEKISNKSAFSSLANNNINGDYLYVLLNTRVSNEDDLTTLEMISVKIYRIIKSLGLSNTEDFGLEVSNIKTEFIPIKLPLKKARNIKSLD